MKKKFIALVMPGCLLFVSFVPGQETKVEKDLLGEKQIPADTYYGAQTSRALENFPDCGVVYSSDLKSLAVKLSRIASDLILLTSGPRAGLAEINLPARQPGSSIMPGKVNPVIPKMINLVAFRVIGNDASASNVFRTKCIDGITVNGKTPARYLETTAGIVMALNPVLGYEKATEPAGEA